ncbi:MAG TPA: hypothetical protein VHG71_12010 [Verrucomicrobiae bacterium]|nr:hypothetical protein [Verrucomicrobiae bacterium]
MKPYFLHGALPSLLCALALLINHANAGNTNRGVWCWKTPSPYGLNYIIGTSSLENAAVAQFKLWGISHVYGSYGDQLATVQGQAALANWNTLLSSNGIESQLLISDTSFGSGDNNILVKMINFNKGQPPSAQLKAVHLDIEPWGLSTWATDNKYNDLVALAGTYQQIRTELDTNGENNVLMYADLADWLDTTTINWPSDSVRNQWFSGILTNLAGITLMAYEQPTFSRIVNVVSWEMTNYPGVVRVGIDAGTGETWSNLDSFLTVAGQVESNYTDSAGIDIYDFITFENIVPPVLSLGSTQPLTPSGFNLMLQGPIGSNCVVQASADLVNWQTVTNILSTTWLTYFNDPTATNYSRQFYRVGP